MVDGEEEQASGLFDHTALLALFLVSVGSVKVMTLEVRYSTLQYLHSRLLKPLFPSFLSFHAHTWVGERYIYEQGRGTTIDTSHLPTQYLRILYPNRPSVISALERHVNRTIFRPALLPDQISSFLGSPPCAPASNQRRSREVLDPHQPHRDPVYIRDFIWPYHTCPR